MGATSRVGTRRNRQFSKRWQNGCLQPGVLGGPRYKCDFFPVAAGTTLLGPIAASVWFEQTYMRNAALNSPDVKVWGRGDVMGWDPRKKQKRLGWGRRDDECRGRK